MAAELSDHPPIEVLLWSLRGSGDHYHGPGTFSYRLFSQRDPRTVRVSLAHANPRQEQLEVFDRQYYLGKLTPLARLNPFFLANSVARWARTKASEFQIFYVLTDYHHAIRPAFAAQEAGMHSVVWVANSGAGLADSASWQRVFGLAAKRREMAKTLSCIIAMSSQIERELLSYGIEERRICRIPNQADVTRFRPSLDAQEKTCLREQLGLRDVPTVILNGKIGWRKRPHLVVEAAEILQRQGLDVQTVFVGPLEKSEYGENFRRLCDRSPLGELIVRAGFSREIELYLRAADVLCLPSENEGMPAAAVEALATGLPLVLTDFSGARDLVDEDPRLGEIVEPTASEVAEALRRFLADGRVADDVVQFCRNRAEETYSAKSVYAAHVALFQRLLAGGDARG